MARYAKSQGKGPGKLNNKSTLKASVHYSENKDGTYTRTQLNDGDKSVYLRGMSAPGKRGTDRPNLIRSETKKRMSEKAAYKDFNSKVDYKKMEADKKKREAAAKKKKAAADAAKEKARRAAKTKRIAERKKKDAAGAKDRLAANKKPKVEIKAAGGGRFSEAYSRKHGQYGDGSKKK